MSAKIRFLSSSSTPTKSKLVNQASSSPTKGSKYKNFLASVLTPSQTKKWLKRKKSVKSEEFLKEAKSKEDVDKGSEISDDFCEPIYSSCQELQMKQTHSIVHSSPVPSKTSSENICNDPLSFEREQNSFKSNEEPLYATVMKEKKRKAQEDTVCRSCNSLSESHEKTDSDENEIKLLKERNEELTNENSELRTHIETLIRDKKWKEESVHASLKLRITQLEANTHKEVNCLSEQIKVLQEERKVLSNEIQMLHEENKLLKRKNEDLSDKLKSTISPEFMKKKMEEQEMLLNQVKKNHLKEVKIFQEENQVLMESKVALMTEVEDLKEKNQALVNKNKALSVSEQETLQEKGRILLQLEESKQMQQEAENMLISLLKISEAISIERDVLLNKSSFQDHQHKLLQSTMMDYSLNMGRLQEHISTISREKSDELKKLKSGEFQRDESMRKFYEQQLDLLHSKIISQNNVILELENEKSKLESQLESFWHAVSSGQSKVGDVT